jgi:hypothetical protein
MNLGVEISYCSRLLYLDVSHRSTSRELEPSS